MKKLYVFGFFAWVYLGVGSCPWSLIGDTAFAGELSVLSRTAIYTNIASFLVILMTTINGTCTSAVKTGMKRFYFPIICISSQFACVSSSAILVEILKSPEAFSKNLWVFEIYRSSINWIVSMSVCLGSLVKITMDSIETDLIKTERYRDGSKVFEE
ncbi:Oidioi.mRNA.OKI2018_I69.chr1.g3108.t1.cds [Oikopleura dioica]|uniref:Oidioi.mRNA.OKI2018_I69.chr1.g3108.t1.cds n=1 Tax=Oikopleura dioica TaxID=34765 RepID=A0ABN7SZM2_OIKDI|nr:Oidioi.mRNA.OKI2018_I69.chr1.g3108.t1.cds [Oikopleura dioica]